MNYTLKNGTHIELSSEDCEDIIWMYWKNAIRNMADDCLSLYSSNPSLYTEHDKDNLAERITNLFFSDEDLDEMKYRHAETVIEEMDEEFNCHVNKCLCTHYSSQDYKILTWNKEDYEELLSSFTDDELCEMYYFVYHHPACPMVIHSCSDDWESKYIIVYEYICLWLVSLLNDGVALHDDVARLLIDAAAAMG